MYQISTEMSTSTDYTRTEADFVCEHALPRRKISRRADRLRLQRVVVHRQSRAMTNSSSTGRIRHCVIHCVAIVADRCAVSAHRRCVQRNLYNGTGHFAVCSLVLP